MELLNLFVMAVMPVLKVLLITALGLFLALDPINLLGPDSRVSLNRCVAANYLIISQLMNHEFMTIKLINVSVDYDDQIVFFVFSPSIILSKLSQTITLQSLLTL